MNVLTSDSSDKFVESESHYSLKRYRIGLCILCVLIAIGIVQTRWFCSLLRGPNEEVITSHIEQSRTLQAQIRKHYLESYGDVKLPRGVSIYEPPVDAHQLFNATQLASLHEAKDFILRDHVLQAELKRKYGVSLNEIDAVVVPGWVIDTPDNNVIIGITKEGWQGCSGGKGQWDVGGFTIRDRPDHPARKTEDGRPRIFLNSNAFQSTRDLRLTLFHEMIHAMNIPGYQSPIVFAQNDLMYLPEYREFIDRNQLQDQWRETFVWVLAVGVFVMLAVLVLLQYLRVSRTLRRARNV